MIRTLIVSLSASVIHDESRKPVAVLRAIPSESWSIEAQRFLEEVVNHTVALTGLKFFNLTRHMILRVGFKGPNLLLIRPWGIT